ncbi:MAG: DNA photolyase family protein, partial [Verrucomicrobia bacterium]|nr:DNA photolyase family protein [Verrucomicrobiota bacterium]
MIMNMKNDIALHWFRQDLRINDNPALFHACQSEKMFAVYIFDEVYGGEDSLGSASRVWLHHSLESLDQDLNRSLSFFKGDPLNILLSLCEKTGANKVTWNRCYQPWAIERDKKIKKALIHKGIEVTSCNGSLLWEPWEIIKDDKTPYKVFTHFYRKGCLTAKTPRKPLEKPENLSLNGKLDDSISLNNIGLLPNIDWEKSVVENWEISEAGARARLKAFFKEGLIQYKEGRNFPAKPYVSRLSPYLHFGQISPNTLWYGAMGEGLEYNSEHFLSELGWREFCYNLLFYNPKLRTENLQTKFNKFPWENDQTKLRSWQKGLTGIPMVDAGMRELWQTGYMHNRVRMIVGSFLVKNLLLDWRLGEKWFWDCLFDADHANNSASWQWVAGCGADAAPYFRIFNPVTQGLKF